MPSIAEFTLPPADFPLGRVFDTRPEVLLELDRVVPSGDTVMPYFWVLDPADDLDAVQSVFAAFPELRSAELLVDMGDRGLFRAEWEPEYLGIMAAIAASGVTVVSATGSADGWRFELRATEDEQPSVFREHCCDLDIDVTLARLSRLSETTTDSGYDLTPDQYEALCLAYDEGYYGDKRSVDLATLATAVGISRQAFASRLRCGYRALIEAAICSDRPRQR